MGRLSGCNVASRIQVGHWLLARAPIGYNLGMSTLPEIESAVDALPVADKQELLLFIAARLRAQAGQLPAPRKFSREQLAAWIAEDEADMQHFRDGKSK